MWYMLPFKSDLLPFRMPTAQHNVTQGIMVKGAHVGASVKTKPPVDLQPDCVSVIQGTPAFCKLNAHQALFFIFFLSNERY